MIFFYKNNVNFMNKITLWHFLLMKKVTIVWMDENKKHVFIFKIA